MERKKIVFILLGATFILVTSVLGLYLRYRFSKKETPVSEISSIFLPTPTPPSATTEELATWVDQSEFSFQYPKSLTLNPHEEDQENYAHLELTSATHAGNLLVWAKDTTALDIEDWLRKTNTQGAIDSTLGGRPAKKIITSNGAFGFTTTVIRDGSLYQIEANLLDYDFWDKVQKIVSSSFKFLPPQKETSEEAPPVYEEEIVEEEVIE